MTDYVIRREGEGAYLVMNGLPFRGHAFEIQRGYGGLTRIIISGRTIELKPGDTLRYEGWDEPAKAPAQIGSAAEFTGAPTRLPYVLPGQRWPADGLHVLAFSLYRLEHGGCWAGDVPTAARVNVAVDWWNGDAKGTDG